MSYGVSPARTERIGPHKRSPWTLAGPSRVIVHASLDAIGRTAVLQVGDLAPHQELYMNAKIHADMDAAISIVKNNISEVAIDAIIDAMEGKPPPIIVVPHPEWDNGDGRFEVNRVANVIPVAFAQAISDIIGASVDQKILQIAKVGRTKLNRIQRFLWQPRFEGDVSQDAPYIIADDVFTLGGTCAALRSHIVGNGGTVIAATALAHKTGNDQPLPISLATIDKLREAFTHDIDAFLRAEVGHDIDCLTEIEGRALLKHVQPGPGEPLLQRLRKEFDTARAC